MAGDGGRGLRALPADVLRQPASGLVGVRAGRLGVFQYESVPFDAASRAFQSRADVDRYLALHACRAAGRDAAGDDGRAAGRLAGSGPGLRQRQSLAGAAPRQGAAAHRPGLRAGGRLAGGGTVYAQCAYPGARHRRIRVHERMTLLPEALALAEQALAAPESEEEAQRVARMGAWASPAAGRRLRAPRRVAIWCCPGRRTACRWNWPCATTGTATRRRRTMSRTRCSTRCSACCAGRRCSRGAGRILPSVPARSRRPGRARFSGAPRRAVPGLPRAAGHAGVSRRDRAPLPRQAGPAVSFVSWDALSEPLLALALDCVPAAHLKRVFERLLSDVKTNRSGLPDLIRFWPDESAMSWSR